MGKVFVVEARRLFPLLFLLLLLISLSIYDNFRHQPTEPVFDELGQEGVMFEVIDRGEVEDQIQVRVLYDQEDFDRVANEFGIELPEYPFQPAQEVGVFVLNAKFNRAEMVSTNEVSQIRVTVDKARDSYDVVSLNRAALEAEGDYHWVFADKSGNVFTQMPGMEQLEIDDEPEDENEEDEQQVIK